MSCALRQVLCQRLDRPENQGILGELTDRYKSTPDQFSYLIPSLELSVPKGLRFDPREVRRNCDICALNPLEECNFGEVLVSVLHDRVTDDRGK